MAYNGFVKNSENSILKKALFTLPTFSSVKKPCLHFFQETFLESVKTTYFIGMNELLEIFLLRICRKCSSYTKPL